MKAIVEINCDNAAFADDPRWELSRILRVLARAIDDDNPREVTLRDLNGNRVGEYRLED